MFKVGDLVKHKSDISWRNQSHRAIVVKIEKADCSNHHEVITVMWSHNRPDSTFGTTKFYDNSLELVARAL